jgi:hypothetical protein
MRLDFRKWLNFCLLRSLGVLHKLMQVAQVIAAARQ